MQVFVLRVFNVFDRSGAQTGLAQFGEVFQLLGDRRRVVGRWHRRGLLFLVGPLLGGGIFGFLRDRWWVLYYVMLLEKLHILLVGTHSEHSSIEVLLELLIWDVGYLALFAVLAIVKLQLL